MQQKHPKNYPVLRSSLTRCERHHYLFTMKRCSEKVCAICNISSDDRIPIVFFIPSANVFFLFLMMVTKQIITRLLSRQKFYKLYLNLNKLLSINTDIIMGVQLLMKDRGQVWEVGGMKVRSWLFHLLSLAKTAAVSSNTNLASNQNVIIRSQMSDFKSFILTFWYINLKLI